jgi:hypothetical protein
MDFLNDGDFGPTDVYADFWDAWPLVQIVYVSDASGTEDYSFDPSASSRDPQHFQLYGSSEELITEVEFCYEALPTPADCPSGSLYFSPDMPALGGWPEDFEFFGDGSFGVDLRGASPGRFAEIDDESIDFESASPPVVTVFVTDRVGTRQHPGDGETYDPATEADAGLTGMWPLVDGGIERATRVEFCYEEPPPPPDSECPGSSIYFDVPRPANGFGDGEYGDGTFSVDLDFYFPAAVVQGGSFGPPLVDFSGASPSVRKVFVSDIFGVSEYPSSSTNYAPPVTAELRLDGGEVSI